MLFEVFDIADKKPVAEFKDIKEAQAVIKGLQSKGKKKYKINKKPEMGGDDSWKKREEGRFAKGDYKAVPWADASWARKKHQDHFCHMSKSGDGTVAYTPDAEYGRADRQVKVRAGKYLQEFFPDLGEAAIRDWADRAVMTHADGMELKFATTKDEIEWVYGNGPSSCMVGGPVGAWATGDFAVAHIVRKDGKRAVSRTVVAPGPKVYVRIYGDGGNYDRLLANRLRDLGYVRSDQAPRGWMAGLKMDMSKARNGGGWPSIEFAHNGYTLNGTVLTFNKYG